MPQEESERVNAGSGESLSTPREASSAPPLHICQLPSSLHSPREERPVVNAGSKECSRCELFVHVSELNFPPPVIFSPPRCQEPSRSHQETDRSANASPTTRASQPVPEVEAVVPDAGATIAAASPTLTTPTSAAAAAAAAEHTGASARSETNVTITSDDATGVIDQDDRALPVPSPLQRALPHLHNGTLTTTSATSSPASRLPTRRRAYSLGSAPDSHLQTYTRAVDAVLTGERQGGRRPTSSLAGEARSRRSWLAPLRSLESRTASDIRLSLREEPSAIAGAVSTAMASSRRPHASERTTIVGTEASNTSNDFRASEEDVHVPAARIAGELTWYAISEESAGTCSRRPLSTPHDHKAVSAPDATSVSAASSLLSADAGIRGVWLDTAITAIPESLVCEICLQLAELPHTTDCGHLFCRDCLSRWLRDHPQCPTDRQPLHTSQVRYDRRAERQIDALTCRCPGSQPLSALRGAAEGMRLIETAMTSPSSLCNWTGCISDALAHTRQCPDAPVRCPFASYGCTTITRRAGMPTHMEAASARHNELLLCSLTALQERHRELLEEVDVLRPRALATTVAAAAGTGFVGFTPLSTAPSPMHIEPLRAPTRRRRHSSPAVTSLAIATVPVVARYIWAITDFSQRLCPTASPARCASHLLSPRASTTPTRATTSPVAGPRLLYSPAFRSAPLPAMAEVREFMETSFSFSSLDLTTAAGSTSAHSMYATSVATAAPVEDSHVHIPPDALLAASTTTTTTAFTPLQWYLGLAPHSSVPGDEGSAHVRWDIYLFGHRHPYRTVFRLTVYHGTDPSRDIVHLVDDWHATFIGKGWGPTNFIDPARLDSEGFVVRDCLRVGVEIIGNPF